MRLDRSLLSFTANQPIQRYAPWVIGPTAGEFKLQVVLEALQSDGTDAEVARAYDIHPVTLSCWKTKLKENGSKAFGSGDELKEKKEKIANLERMLGRKEVEIAMLKNFLGES